jgi:uncharacterized protein YecE (DUF72 family)
MTEFYIGTMGFSYEDWKGVFYPSGTPARNYLAYHARFFNAVESEFIHIMRLLGDKLGVILVQLPPRYASDMLPVLVTFLDELPSDIHFAVEFRHRSWYTEQTADLLAKYRISWVAIEYADLPCHLEATAEFLYIRWLGKYAAFQRYDREQIDRSLRLDWWKEQVQHYINKTQVVYGFFNNDYSGFAPSTCNRFKKLLNLPYIDFRQPVQSRLF